MIHINDKYKVRKTFHNSIFCEELYAGFKIPGYEEPFLLNEFIRTNYHG